MATFKWHQQRAGGLTKPPLAQPPAQGTSEGIIKSQGMQEGARAAPHTRTGKG